MRNANLLFLTVTFLFALSTSARARTGEDEFAEFLLDLTIVFLVVVGLFVVGILVLFAIRESRTRSGVLRTRRLYLEACQKSAGERTVGEAARTRLVLRPSRSHRTMRG